jgi:hypothetical protein|tara:strand:+ start:6841 stop:7053 length:213 start_codon:yes stop_codon:yes gene_type:complete
MKKKKTISWLFIILSIISILFFIKIDLPLSLLLSVSLEEKGEMIGRFLLHSIIFNLGLYWGFGLFKEEKK